MFRIEPLKKDGKIDADFLFTEEFKQYKKKVNNYLKLEGFETITSDEIIIDLFNRRWLVKWFN